MRRTFRLFIGGLVGASVAAAATLTHAIAPAFAVGPTPEQLRTLQIPKRTDLSAPPSAAGDTVATLPNLDGIKIGNGLRPSIAGSPTSILTPAPTTPLTGLSLGSPSLSPPLAPSTGSGDRSALSQQGGNILYSVLPNSGFTPYIGLGAGGAAGKLDNGLTGASNGMHSYDGLAGFAYKLDKDTSLDFDYRMSNTQRPNVPIDNNPDIADAARDRAAILSFHYDLHPDFRQPPSP